MVIQKRASNQVAMRYCCVQGCGVKSGGSDKVFRLPKDPNLRVMWLNACKRAEKIEMNTSNVFVCARHFSPEQFEWNCRSHIMGGNDPRNYRGLKTNAVPDQNIPGEIHSLTGELDIGLRVT